MHVTFVFLSGGGTSLKAGGPALIAPPAPGASAEGFDAAGAQALGPFGAAAGGVARLRHHAPPGASISDLA